MTNIINVKESVKDSVLKFLNINESVKINIEDTKKDFQGDLTVVVFSLLKFSKKSPELTANEIGDFLLANEIFFENYNVVKGFLNLTIKHKYWLQFFKSWKEDQDYGFNKKLSGELYMVEYSSPNTNKPLHLGHLRNIFLGDSISSILEAAGHEVVRTQIINDRGIHICKSMLAWLKEGNGETPDSTKIKGDHFVGKYYVTFNRIYKEEISSLIDSGMSEKEAKIKAPILLEAQKMLLQWEQGDPEVRSLWEKMNNWVYDGFENTYNNLGVVFDKLYYESDTYHIGKEVVNNGLESNIFYSKDDKSIWCNLSSEKMDDKLLSRSDGTSVYMTQDIGTAIQRFRDYPKLSGIIYTVGNEQNHHFKVLFKILEKLNYSWASNCLHLSYGMVELPDGKMKSREGTVVDADELLSSIISEAKSLTSERGFLEELPESEIYDICEKIGIAGLKYFLLKVDSKKKMSFNPKETIDLSGHTGPFIQYTYVRIKSLLKKVEDIKTDFNTNEVAISSKELEVLKSISNFPKVIIESSKELSPYLLANYLYSLVKSYNAFYQDYPIISEQNLNNKNFRIQLSMLTSSIIEKGMKLLGIRMPKRM
tara:strand:- start:464 stop:2245 length:1782 start_codon:yes stop_codon:yes gene_type:complete